MDAEFLQASLGVLSKNKRKRSISPRSRRRTSSSSSSPSSRASSACLARPLSAPFKKKIAFFSKKLWFPLPDKLHQRIALTNTVVELCFSVQFRRELLHDLALSKKLPLQRKKLIDLIAFQWDSELADHLHLRPANHSKREPDRNEHYSTNVACKLVRILHNLGFLVAVENTHSTTRNGQKIITDYTEMTLTAQGFGDAVMYKPDDVTSSTKGFGSHEEHQKYLLDQVKRLLDSDKQPLQLPLPQFAYDRHEALGRQAVAYITRGPKIHREIILQAFDRECKMASKRGKGHTYVEWIVWLAFDSSPGFELFKDLRIRSSSELFRSSDEELAQKAWCMSLAAGVLYSLVHQGFLIETNVTFTLSKLGREEAAVSEPLANEDEEDDDGRRDDGIINEAVEHEPHPSGSDVASVDKVMDDDHHDTMIHDYFDEHDLHAADDYYISSRNSYSEEDEIEDLSHIALSSNHHHHHHPYDPASASAVVDHRDEDAIVGSSHHLPVAAVSLPSFADSIGRTSSSSSLMTCIEARDTSVRSAGLLGLFISNFADVNQHHQAHVEDYVYLNTDDSFFLVTVGDEGSGTHHTMTVLLENALIACEAVSDQVPFVKLPERISTLVLRYDPTASKQVCQATELLQPLHGLLPENMCVLTSPVFFKQSQALYKPYHCVVKPLLFSWKHMTCAQMKVLLNLDELSQCGSLALDVLRRHHRSTAKPSFHSFISELEDVCRRCSSSSGSLSRRLALLESFVSDSDTNVSSFGVVGAAGADIISTTFQSGAVVIVDLNDSLLSAKEASSIFQVMLETFRATSSTSKKMVMFEDTHRYLSGPSSSLYRSILETVQQKKAVRTSVVLGSQSPRSIPSELLEMANVAIVHRFHNRFWHQHVIEALPEFESIFDEIVDLPDRHALVYASKHGFHNRSSLNLLRISMRSRIAGTRQQNS